MINPHRNVILWRFSLDRRQAISSNCFPWSFKFHINKVTLEIIRYTYFRRWFRVVSGSDLFFLFWDKHLHFTITLMPVGWNRCYAGVCVGGVGEGGGLESWNLETDKCSQPVICCSLEKKNVKTSKGLIVLVQLNSAMQMGCSHFTEIEDKRRRSCN